MKKKENEKENVLEALGLIGLLIFLIGVFMIADREAFVLTSEHSYCLETKGYWDKKQKTCKYKDCSRWKPGKCIPLTEEDEKEIERLENITEE